MFAYVLLSEFLFSLLFASIILCYYLFVPPLVPPSISLLSHEFLLPLDSAFISLEAQGHEVVLKIK